MEQSTVHSPVPGLSVVCTANGPFTLRGTGTGVATGKGTALAGPRGRQGPAPLGSKFFHLHAVFWQNDRLAHPLWELVPPQENPGSTTALAQ